MSVWASFDHDPRDPRHAGLRASDGERELVRSVLVAAFGDGRLDRGELDERSDAVGSARTLGELAALIRDLVPDEVDVRAPGGLVAASTADLQRMAEEEWRSERRNAVRGFVGASLLCWVIWVATSFGDEGFEPYFPWPLIVMAASLANLIRVMATREEIVRDEVRRLEKKQAKQLRSRRPRGLGGGER